MTSISVLLKDYLGHVWNKFDVKLHVLSIADVIVVVATEPCTANYMVVVVAAEPCTANYMVVVVVSELFTANYMVVVVVIATGTRWYCH